MKIDWEGILVHLIIIYLIVMAIASFFFTIVCVGIVIHLLMGLI